MTVPANGTFAKEIAIRFVELTQERITPLIMKKTINQAKSLLQSGYSKDEILSVIDCVLEKGTIMHSLGYVSACINDVLKEIQQKKDAQKAASIRAEFEQAQKAQQSEVNVDAESAERNRQKASRFGIQPGKREKYSFDLFEGQ